MSASTKDMGGLIKFSRLADYLAAAQIYLKDNVLLDAPLAPEHLKPRLLGHWGTAPGINFVYAHLNRLIRNTPDRDFLYIIGPGHGFPAYQAGLFIEGSLSHYYPETIPFNKKGLEEIIARFSAPYGYPSHVNPEAPGAILEGGELGYSLAVAAGAVLDEPELVAVCLIGDGEAETGPLAASWNINRFLRPGKDGAVLPVLHLNGYKISGPTIFGRMEDDEIDAFLGAHGYEPLFVVGETPEELHGRAMEAFDAAIERIRLIQATEQMAPVERPRWPVVVLKTPKGMGALETLHGEKIVGNAASHQVIFKDPWHDAEELRALEAWLSRYRVHELISFDESGNLVLDADIQKLLPAPERRVGRSRYAHRGAVSFQIPDASLLMEPQRGEGATDSATQAGRFFAQSYHENPTVFRLFSPDETYSNHLDAVFAETKRVWRWDIAPWDKDLSPDGRVVELLSEHVLFGMAMGYALTGRVGVFASYEAFAHIVSSMLDQYVKFIKVAREVPFRKGVPALNIFLTSLLERQDHNGFSHQNPSFITNALAHDWDLLRVFFPPDQNTLLAIFERELLSRNQVNIFVAGKRHKMVYYTPDEAVHVVQNGLAPLPKYDHDAPAVVLVGVGGYVLEELRQSMLLLRQYLPEVPVRLVALSHFKLFKEAAAGSASAKDIIFAHLTAKQPVLWYYHGYPTTIAGMLFGVVPAHRLQIFGYQEQGSTTTPFDMHARNERSRFHVVMHVAQEATKLGLIDAKRRDELVARMQKLLEKEKAYIIKHGVDPDDINQWAYEQGV